MDEGNGGLFACIIVGAIFGFLANIWNDLTGG